MSRRPRPTAGYPVQIGRCRVDLKGVHPLPALAFGRARRLRLRLGLGGVAPAVAVRLRRSRRADRVDRATDRRELLECLTRIQQSITRRAPLEEVLEAIVAGAAELLGDEMVALRLLASDCSDTLELAASVGIAADPSIRRISTAHGVAGRAFTEQRLVVTDSYAGSPMSLARLVQLGCTAAMAAPVREDGTVVGALVVASTREGRSYGPAEQDVLASFADHASLALTNARAVRELHAALQSARHDALHDPLTGLANRTLLHDRLEHALPRADRRRRPVAVLFLDVDGFKRVNDSLGHAAGDALLVALAERLGTCVRGSDTVARLGGDEFAVLLEDIDQAADAERLAERVLEVLRAPFHLPPHKVTVTASIGIAASTGEGEAAGDLLRNADLAMYQAKAGGKGRHCWFEPGMHATSLARLELEEALRRALKRGELVAYFQPVVDLATGEIAGAEALVRWPHQGRLVPPADFLAVAEATGLVVPLGEQMLARACQQAAAWQEMHAAGRAGRAPSVSVNLSPQQLAPGLAEGVARVLSEAGVPPGLLILEIVEGALMSGSAAGVEELAKLRAAGVRLAIDDFGTGHSSLGRLRDLPVDQLKIDRSFVADADGSDEAAALLRGIVALGRGLGLTVVGEGVESARQAEVLRAAGCDRAQGYLFGRPMTAGELSRRLAERPG